MKRTLLLRPAQCQPAFAPPSQFRCISVLRNASSGSYTSHEPGMALSLDPTPRRRSRLAATDANVIANDPALSSDRRRQSTIAKRRFTSAHNPLKPLRSASRSRSLRGKARPKPHDVALDAEKDHDGETSAKSVSEVRARPDFPTADQLPPRLKKEVLTTPKHYLIERIRVIARCTESWTRAATGSIISRVNIDWNESSLESVQGIGQASTKIESNKVAWTDALLALHQKGLLDLCQPPLKMESVNNEVAAEQKDALVDVYNYCAKYGEIPIIQRAYKQSRNRLLCHVKLAFPLHGITVDAVGPDAAQAETMVSIKFKDAAERYHTDKGTDSLLVKANDALNTENVEEFFVFYRLRYRTSWPKVDFSDRKEAKKPFEATVMLGNETIGEPIHLAGKKRLMKLALLNAALTLAREKPELMDDFLDALKLGNGKIKVPMPPLDLPIDDTAVLLMRDTLAKARQHGLGDQYQPLGAEQVADVDVTFARRTPNPLHLQTRNNELTKSRAEYQSSARLADMRNLRELLPMNQKASEVLDIIDQNLYSIVIGETGSGKTTQVPQILLDHYTDRGIGSECNVICTQPRRIAATSVSERVAAERGEPLSQTVGYHVRGNAKRAKDAGSINYCTTGVLLAQLQTDPDKVMEGASHIIIDEVHERDKFIDYLMIILKQIIAKRLADEKSVPRIVLMSATLDPSLFAPYFKSKQGDGSLANAPVLRVPGRTFPVAEKHLETIYAEMKQAYSDAFVRYINGDEQTRDYMQYEREFSSQNPVEGESSTFGEDQAPSRVIDWKRKQSFEAEQAGSAASEDKLVPIRLVAATIAHIAQTTSEGAILTFLPGWDEIVLVQKELEKSRPLGFDLSDQRYELHTLHSSIEQQAGLFVPAKPGRRKIILSTNIAETSVTIPDVQYVVDTGKSRELQYDQNRRITALTCAWISRSNAKQRAGRAGRVQNGNYYGLYTKPRKQALRIVGLPELLRTDLQDTCLDILAQKWPTPPREFLAAALEPPESIAVNGALSSLRQLDAVTKDEELTPLGRLLSTLPIHPELGKMVVLGIIFRCLDPMIVLGAAHGSRSLFLMPTADKRAAVNAARAHFSGPNNSDHMAILNAFTTVRSLRRTRGMQVARKFCMDNCIHWGAYQQIEASAALVENALMQARIIPIIMSADRSSNQYGHGDLNTNSKRSHVIKALLTAGLYPRLAVKADDKKMFWRTDSEQELAMHPGSVNVEKKDKAALRESYARGASSHSRTSQFAVFDQLAKSLAGNKMYIRQTSLVSPLAVALFCGRLTPAKLPNRSDNSNNRAWIDQLRGSESQRIVEVDQWLPFYLQSDDRLVLRTIVEMRKGLERMLVRAYADLSKHQLLTDDPVRAVFSDGIVDILGMDLNAQAVSSRDERRPSDDTLKNSVFEQMKSRLIDVQKKPALKPETLQSARLTPKMLDTPMLSPKKDRPVAAKLGMLEWAARWEARARARAEALKNEQHS